jgi:hypothetical protein
MLSRKSGILDRLRCNRGKAGKKAKELRQVRVRLGKSCQMKEQLLPGLASNGAKLSEERATSARFGGKRRKAVRRESNFCQVWGQTEKSCQKKEQLLPGSAPNGEKLSEERATSARFGAKRRKAVRRKSNFCQVRRQKEKSCQKKEQLLPGSAPNGEKLSEERATSARFGGKRRKAVRRESNFCQVWRQTEKSCQKKEQLLPGLASNGEKLSEKRATSSRSGAKRRKAVRRKSNFCQV